MYLNLSPSEDGLDTYETVNEDKQEHTYADVKNINGTSRCDNSEFFSHQQEARTQNEHNDGYLIPTDGSAMVHTEGYRDNSMENDERKDRVYAVVHIQPGEGKAKFCKELVVQGESLDATRSSQLYANGEHSMQFENPASPGAENEVANSGTPTEGEPNTQGGDAESKDYLYAVVDKAKKKRKPPQVIHVYMSLSI